MDLKLLEKTNGPCIILAGAGTGKTHTIIKKINHLINNEKIPAKKIICLTFSNEAANSLLSRVRKNISSEEPIINTFHALSSNILKKHGELINLSKDFKILTPEDAKILLHSNFKISINNCHKYIAKISTAKDLEIEIKTLENYLSTKEKNYKNIDLEKKLENLKFELHTAHLKKSKKPEVKAEIKNLKKIIDLKKFIKTWLAYEKLKSLKNYQDYSDLNKNMLYLLKKNPEIAEKYSHIIVDEFQDTNKIQLEILKSLAPHKNITIVGDLNQSIYRFRGAYNKNLEEFKKHFSIKSKDIFNLSNSYRSSNIILKAAHKLITNNYQNPKDSFVVKNAFDKMGEKIKVYELLNSKEEARKIVEIIEQEIKSGTPKEEICVMFRTHQFSKIIKQTLKDKNITFTSASKSPLLKQKSIKIIIDYLTILDKLKRKDSGGIQAWWDLIYQLNVVESDLILIGKYLKENKNIERLSTKLILSLPKLNLQPSGERKIKLLIERIKLMLPLLNNSVPRLIKSVINCSGIIKENAIEKETILNLNKFKELSTNHSQFYEPTLYHFLHHIKMIKDLGIEISASELSKGGINLMTLHSTKGLEYKTVIVSNLAQKRFPMEKISESQLLPIEISSEFSKNKESSEEIIQNYEREQQIKEERRLCYVAFTRAKEKLILTFAKEYNNRKFLPSQFLNEINYKQNKDISFFQDKDEKYISKKPTIVQSISLDNAINNSNALINIYSKQQNNKTEKISFSPTSLLLFSNCQKKYEYKYVFNMPEETNKSWDSLLLGSFVHTILEKGVKNNFRNLKDFEDYASELYAKKDWESIDIRDAKQLIRIFFERNKSKYNKFSKTEQSLSMKIDKIKFVGFADRIDFTDKGIEIIDYKTGQSKISPKNRNWQLGLYALASKNLGKVYKITLDTLRHERPLEFVLDSQGNAKSIFSNISFNIYNIKEEILSTAKEILKARTNGFKYCSKEKNCEFCQEYSY